jgi:ABC-2 type transport system permease protein
LRSRSSARGARWLRRKEFVELAHSPAFALLLVLVSLLVGHEFISAVQTYSEMSGSGGGSAALAQGMNPLDGILVPTFGAYDLAATLLLPFVVIRLFSGERATGAWTVLVQSPATVAGMVATKVFALSAAWMLALLPGLIAVALWKSYGGHVHGAELATLLFGHLLRAAFTIALAAAAAALTSQAATAAIVTLGVTIGSWALDFAAATRGGAWAKIAAFTPTATLRAFEQGLIRASTVLTMAGLCVLGLAVAIVWLSPGVRARTRGMYALRALLFLALWTGTALTLRSSADVTEDRRHSFPAADEAVLRSLASPLSVEVHLGAEDPRLADLRHEVLDKLERVVPRVKVQMVGAGGTGMFASADAKYGEVWYEYEGRREMLKSAIEPVVLATIYQLAGKRATPVTVENSYDGYPLKTEAAFASTIFFVLWPAAVAAAWWRVRRG